VANSKAPPAVADQRRVNTTGMSRGDESNCLLLRSATDARDNGGLEGI